MADLNAIAPTTVQAPASTPPAPTPAPSPAPGPTTPEPDAFAAFDKAFAEDVTKPTEAPAMPTGDAVPPKPAAKPAEPAKPAQAAPANPQAPKLLREELERTRAEAKTLRDKSAELEKRIAEAESRGKDADALKARLAAVEKERDEKLAENRVLRQEVSPEFVERYEKPFNQAADETKSIVEELVGQVVDQAGQPRAATFQDFAELYGMKFGPALAKAKEIWGEDQYMMVMQQYSRLKSLDRAKATALQEEQRGWKEREQTARAQQIQRAESEKAAWEKANSDLRDDPGMPDYRDDPADAEAVKIRKEGYELFDAKPKTPQQALLRAAHVRHRLAAYGVIKLQNRRHEAKIKELETKLAEYTVDPPNPSGRTGGGEGGKPQDTEADWTREALAIDRKG